MRLPGRRRERPGTEPVDLDELVSPLRYDILVRARFLELLRRRRLAYQRDPEGFLREAVEHPYHTWFVTIALPRFRPRDAADPARRDRAFRERVRRSAALLASFERRGFDPRHPVSLRTAAPGAATASGKLVPRALYAGDGCHRLALLLMAGRRLLEPAWYRVRAEPLPAPIDNTHALLGPLGVGAGEYHRFLSRGYAGVAISDRDALLRHVAAHRPDRLQELKRVLEVDERLLVREDHGAEGSNSPIG